MSGDGKERSAGDRRAGPGGNKGRGILNLPRRLRKGDGAGRVESQAKEIRAIGRAGSGVETAKRDASGAESGRKSKTEGRGRFREEIVIPDKAERAGPAGGAEKGVPVGPALGRIGVKRVRKTSTGELVDADDRPAVVLMIPDPINLILIQEALSDHGMRVRGVGSVEDGLADFIDDPPELIVADASLVSSRHHFFFKRVVRPLRKRGGRILLLGKEERKMPWPWYDRPLIRSGDLEDLIRIVKAEIRT